MKTKFDIEKTPLVTIWEVNHQEAQSPALSNDHVCASGSFPAEIAVKAEHPDALELGTHEAEKLIRDVAELAPPIFIISGSDPLKRPDLYPLVQYAAGRGLHPIVACAASPLLNRNAIAELRHAGAARLALTLNGATPELHDLISGIHGSYSRTIEAIHWANEWRLPIQITTHLTTDNLNDLPNLAALLKGFKVMLWTVAFPVPAARSDMENLPTAREFEQTFAVLHKLAQQVPFKIKTLEAQHYRRHVLQQKAKDRSNKLWHGQSFAEGIPGVLPVNEARATLFISSTGEVSPEPALQISGGNIRVKSLADIYRKSELFTALRDPANLVGKCGECAFQDVCGGSRARALILTGDLFQEDATCIYQPGAEPRVRNQQAPEMPPLAATVEEP